MPLFLPRARLAELLTALSGAGYRCIGPLVRDGAIVYDELHSADELPAGVGLEARPGSVRLTRNGSKWQFAWANGPQALKPLLFAPVEPLWQARRDAGGGLTFESLLPDAPPSAVIGVRACDLAALRLLDRHFLEQGVSDPHYAARRASLFLVAVHCTHPADTCFCAATGDGPGVDEGYDLLLDELDEGFLVRSGSRRATALLDPLGLEPAGEQQRAAAVEAVRRAAEQQTRTLPGGNLFQALAAQRDHPRWDEVAERCLACGNCTLVCPSCFCHREQEQPRLDGSASMHVREWDSCFSEGHSYIHGIVIRKATSHRYRQWLSHKLGAWHPQYGRSGCVGCGRCIAWCPVGIDITEEVAAVLGASDDT